MSLQLHDGTPLPQSCKEECAQQYTYCRCATQQSYANGIKSSGVNTEGVAYQGIGKLPHQTKCSCQASEGSGKRHHKKNIPLNRDASIPCRFLVLSNHPYLIPERCTRNDEPVNNQGK